MRRVGSALAAVALIYIVVLLLAYALQDRLIYFPTRSLDATPRVIGLAYEDVWLTTEDGVRLHGWYVPLANARATVLHFHGNGGNISHRIERIAIFRELGLEVFLFDYRGYGRSNGRPSEYGMYRDARAAWDYLVRTRGLPSARVVLHGESLGGGVASWLAAQETPGALIIESSFTSAVDVGAEAYRWLPVRRLARHVYPTEKHLTHNRAPVLIVHSEQDEIIPYRHAQRLYAVAREPKRLATLRGDHNRGFLLNRSEYIAGLADFLHFALGARGRSAIASSSNGRI